MNGPDICEVRIERSDEVEVWDDHESERFVRVNRPGFFLNEV